MVKVSNSGQSEVETHTTC